MKIYLWGGMLAVILSVLVSFANYKQYKVQNTGAVVKMQIVKMPESCIGTKVKHYAKFFYDGVTYIKDVGPKFCDNHYVGESVDMKYLEGNSIILYPDESVTFVFYMFGFFACIGLGLVVYYFFKR